MPSQELVSSQEPVLSQGAPLWQDPLSQDVLPEKAVPEEYHRFVIAEKPMHRVIDKMLTEAAPDLSVPFKVTTEARNMIHIEVERYIILLVGDAKDLSDELSKKVKPMTSISSADMKLSQATQIKARSGNQGIRLNMFLQC